MYLHTFKRFSRFAAFAHTDVAVREMLGLVPHWTHACGCNSIHIRLGGRILSRNVFLGGGGGGGEDGRVRCTLGRGLGSSPPGKC